jgi:tRNA U38,U39,U40 pseudouridine synthase TruA
LVAEFRQQGDHLLFEIVADGFLRHMIRIIMGTLLDVGRGRLQSEAFKAILEGQDRKHASKTISPHGLCLLEVGYRPFDLHTENAPTDLSRVWSKRSCLDRLSPNGENINLFNTHAVRPERVEG